MPAFAQPAFTTIARARPPARCSLERSTGAAWARLLVKTPAALHGVSATSSARSCRPGLIPAGTAAARKPSGAVTPDRRAARHFWDWGRPTGCVVSTAFTSVVTRSRVSARTRSGSPNSRMKPSASLWS